MTIPIKENTLLRLLDTKDIEALSAYFNGFSDDTKRRFQPHPFTPEVIQKICQHPDPNVQRYVLVREEQIIGYFILGNRVSQHEQDRYQAQGIVLEVKKDFRFAPSISDAFQNEGLASAVMPHLIDVAKQAGARSLVLMGGVQATNPRAIAFYEKFGFVRHGGYQTDVYNHDMRLVLF